MAKVKFLGLGNATPLDCSETISLVGPPRMGKSNMSLLFALLLASADAPKLPKSLAARKTSRRRK